MTNNVTPATLTASFGGLPLLDYVVDYAVNKTKDLGWQAFKGAVKTSLWTADALTSKVLYSGSNYIAKTAPSTLFWAGKQAVSIPRSLVNSGLQTIGLLSSDSAPTPKYDPLGDLIKDASYKASQNISATSTSLVYSLEESLTRKLFTPEVFTKMQEAAKQAGILEQETVAARFSAFDLIAPTILMSLCAKKCADNAAIAFKYVHLLLSGTDTITTGYGNFSHTKVYTTTGLLKDAGSHFTFSAMWGYLTYATKNGIQAALIDAGSDPENAEKIANIALVVASTAPQILKVLSILWTKIPSIQWQSPSEEPKNGCWKWNREKQKFEYNTDNCTSAAPAA